MYSIYNLQSSAVLIHSSCYFKLPCIVFIQGTRPHDCVLLDMFQNSMYSIFTSWFPLQTNTGLGFKIPCIVFLPIGGINGFVGKREFQNSMYSIFLQKKNNLLIRLGFKIPCIVFLLCTRCGFWWRLAGFKIPCIVFLLARFGFKVMILDCFKIPCIVFLLCSPALALAERFDVSKFHV